MDDARAFFRRPSGPYDLVWFGLLDSHTTPSAYANVRLDHFVYTQESFADMKRLLSPSGVVVLLFAPQTEWITGRLVDLLTRTFGEVPLAVNTTILLPLPGLGRPPPDRRIAGGAVPREGARRARPRVVLPPRRHEPDPA